MRFAKNGGTKKIYKECSFIHRLFLNFIANTTISPPITAPRELLNKSSTSKTPLVQINCENSVANETNKPTIKAFKILYLSDISPTIMPTGIKQRIFRQLPLKLRLSR